jgi:hypothetical protein
MIKALNKFKKFFIVFSVLTFLLLLLPCNFCVSCGNTTSQPSCSNKDCMAESFARHVKENAFFSKVIPKIRVSFLGILFIALIGYLSYSIKIQHFSILQKLRLYSNRHIFKLFSLFTEIFSSGTLHPKYY